MPPTQALAELLEDVLKSAPSKYFLESGEKALERQGKTAKIFAGVLKSVRDKSEGEVGKAIQEHLTDTQGFRNDPQRWARYWEYLDKGTIPQGDPEVLKAGLNEKLRLEDIFDRGVKAKVADAKHRVNGSYAPHMFPPDIFKGISRERAIQHLINTGQAQSVAGAEKILEYIKPMSQKAHTLESPRSVNLPGYRMDPAVFADHYASALRRITWAENLGPKGELAHVLMNQIHAEGGDSRFAHLVYDIESGTHAGSARPEWERKISSFEGLTKLGQATIPHTGQSLNTLIMTGAKPYMEGLLKTIGDYGNAKEFALRSGGLVHETLRQLRLEAGASQRTLGDQLLHYTGFSLVRRFNQIVSANAGKRFAQEQFELLSHNPQNKLALKNLYSLGINAANALKNGLTPGDLENAAKRVTDTTQFTRSALELPVGWQINPATRMIFMYKQFVFSQAKFIKNYVFKPLIVDKNPRPLIYFATVFPLFGELVADVKNLLRTGSLDKRPKQEVDRALDNMSYVGAHSMAEDMMYALTSPDSSNMASFAMGPVLSDIIMTPQKIISSKKPLRTAEQEAIRRIPVFGTLLKNILLPPERPPKPGPLQRGEVTREINKLTEEVTR
jgi:hypothetical protein